MLKWSCLVVRILQPTMRLLLRVSLVGFCMLDAECGLVSGCGYEVCRSAQCGKERLGLSMLAKYEV